MIHITDEDYRQLAMKIEDASYEYGGYFKKCIQYDTDRFNSDLTVEVLPYDTGISDEGLFIVFAKMETSIPESKEENDFDLKKLRSYIC